MFATLSSSSVMTNKKQTGTSLFAIAKKRSCGSIKTEGNH